MTGGDTCRNKKEYLVPFDKPPTLSQMSVIDLEGCSRLPMSLQGLGVTPDNDTEELLLLPLHGGTGGWAILAASDVDGCAPVQNISVSIESALL